MPLLGLGVYKIPAGIETEKAVLSALEIGYRLIDTAELYGNEESVGAAIRKSNIPRNEIFVTTKLHPATLVNPEKSFYGSLERLGFDYIDLYLIHWPFVRKNSTWKKLEHLYHKALIRAIGVSNFSVEDIESLLKESDIVPAVNQIELHPFHHNHNILYYCRAKNIAIEAHSPLTHGKKLNNTVITEIAKRYQKTPAVIILRWILQQQIIAIPKSVHENYMRENTTALFFELSNNDMLLLNSLNENQSVAWLSWFSDLKK